MTPEHQQLLSMLANAGRLGAFAVWPLPPGMDPERNLVTPRLLVDGTERTMPELRPISFADPDWVANGWAELDAGPPNKGCAAMPYCPKGWCRGDPACPWAALQLGNITDAVNVTTREID